MSNRKGAGGAKAKVEAKCGDCSKPVLEKDKGLQCEVCESWYHIKCQNISEDVYTVLQEVDSVHWYCTACNKGVTKMLQTLSVVQAKQERLEADFIQMRNKLEKEMLEMKKEYWELSKRLGENEKVQVELDGIKKDVASNRSYAETLKSDISTSVKSNISASFTAGNDVKVKMQVNEAMEVEKRKNNLVIMGIKETCGEDGEDLKTLVESVFEHIMDGEKVRFDIEGRIGKSTDGKIRPVRIKILATENKGKILRGAKSLKDSNFPKIYVVPDLTKKQQEEDKSLRDKVKELKAEGKEQVRIVKKKVVAKVKGKDEVFLDLSQ